MPFSARIRLLLLAAGIGCGVALVPVGIALAGDGRPVAEIAGPEAKARVLNTVEVSSQRRACNTTVEQPGGVNTTIYVYYNNCGTLRLRLTPFGRAVAFDGFYTYVGSCAVVPGGTTVGWAVSPSQFPPVETHNWGLTNCM
ncbi:hypothetical protein [Amycolatopsis keratiniphila]|uniref:Uncharacterized protein n=1 Tax=Amycolatopsis keratiniphila subsp. keratiniphila TaxID=227715 RepID=A0A1W2M144_9PSEU|nr:hypothetical protein [Amycolatopsis keratiniphila]ONF73066.1 hypothetical protein AVR91_0207260 [Amycolatopsis keratiniphila subsp. keratiniphila]